VQLEAILCSGESAEPDQFDEREAFVWLVISRAREV
jgi:hypothetical protein